MQQATPLTDDERSDAFVLIHNGQPVVRPAFLVVDGQTKKKFTVRNLTGRADVRVRVDAQYVPANNDRVLGARGRATFHLALNPQIEQFSYEVWVGSDKAQGDSDPVIIIDPPTP